MGMWPQMTESGFESYMQRQLTMEVRQRTTAVAPSIPGILFFITPNIVLFVLKTKLFIIDAHFVFVVFFIPGHGVGIAFVLTGSQTHSFTTSCLSASCFTDSFPLAFFLSFFFV